MKVAGFTIARNVVKYDYPIVESIRSILPIVDEYIISLGDSEDKTEELIRSIDSEKIKLVHSKWDQNLLEGKVLAVETDKAMDAISPGPDWLFYLQADEVIHERYLPVIQEAMKKFSDDHRIEGLLFRYIHFYGSYRYVGMGRQWYSKEIRIIRNDKKIRAYRDAQGFRIAGRKLRVKLINAFVYHYGWVKNPLFMKNKFRDFARFWNDEHTFRQWAEEEDKKGNLFDYSEIDFLGEFTGTHPKVMQDRINRVDWDFNLDVKKKNFKSLRHRLLYYIEKYFGWRPFEYRNYRIV